MKRVHKATILDLSQHGIASSICLCWPDLISTLLGYPAETQIRLREPRPKRAKKAVRNPARRSSKSWEKAGHFVLWKKRANGDYVFKKNLPIYKQKVNPLPLFSQRVALIQPALHLNWDAEPGALHSSGKRKGDFHMWESWSQVIIGMGLDTDQVTILNLGLKSRTPPKPHICP